MLGDHGRSITRRVFTPSARLLAKAGITPNQVMVTGTLFSVGIVVSTLPFGYIWQGVLALALVLLADSADGTLARVTNGGTRFGAFLDSTLDRIADDAVFASFTARAAFSLPEGLPCTLVIGFGLAAIIGAETVPYAGVRVGPIGVEAELGITKRIDRPPIVILSTVFTDSGWGVRWLVIDPGWVTFASFIIVIQRIVSTAKAVKEETQARRGDMAPRPEEDK